MAIRQFLKFSRPLYGDGEATSVTIDFAEEIKASHICGGDPQEVKDAASDKGDVTPSVSGTKVTFAFAEGLPAPEGIFTVSGELLFGEKAKAKAQAKDDKEEKGHHHKK